MLFNLYFFKTIISNLLISSRFGTSSVVASAIFIILLYNNISIFNGVIHGIVFLFVTMFGFLINDIFDYEKDKKTGRKDKLIAQDILRKKVAINYSILWVGISVSIETLIGNIYSILIVMSTLVLLYLYSFISKYYPLLKGSITAILCFSPIIYTSYLINLNLSWLVYFLIFIFIFGRELYLDAKDYDNDKVVGLKTLAFYLGEKKSKFIGIFIMLIASIVLFIYSLLSIDIFYIHILSFVTFALTLFSFYLSFRDEKRTILFTKIVILFSILPILNITA